MNDITEELPNYMKNTRVSDVTKNIITIYAGRARICCNTINESPRMNIYSAHIDIEISFAEMPFSSAIIK